MNVKRIRDQLKDMFRTTIDGNFFSPHNDKQKNGRNLVESRFIAIEQYMESVLSDAENYK